MALTLYAILIFTTVYQLCFLLESRRELGSVRVRVGLGLGVGFEHPTHTQVFNLEGKPVFPECKGFYFDPQIAYCFAFKVLKERITECLNLILMKERPSFVFIAEHR